MEEPTEPLTFASQEDLALAERDLRLYGRALVDPDSRHVSGSFTADLSPGDVEALRRWADAYTGAPPRLNRRERRAAARRERRRIGAWRAALCLASDAAEHACWVGHRRLKHTRAVRLADRMVESLFRVWDLPPRDRRPLSEWMRANPGPWPSEVFHG